MELSDDLKSITLESLPNFLDKLVNAETSIYIHEALAIGAYATMQALMKTPNFKTQRNIIGPALWELIKNFSHSDSFFPVMLRIKTALNSEVPTGTISLTPEVFTMLQEEARVLLDKNNDSPDHIKLYWKSIINGKVPPGFTVINTH